MTYCNVNLYNPLSKKSPELALRTFLTPWEIIIAFLISVLASVLACYICKWLGRNKAVKDKYREGIPGCLQFLLAAYGPGHIKDREELTAEAVGGLVFMLMIIGDEVRSSPEVKEETSAQGTHQIMVQDAGCFKTL